MDHGSEQNKAAIETLKKADALSVSEQYEEALDLYLSLFDMQVEAVPIWQKWQRVGVSHQKMGNFKKAIDALERTVFLFDEFAEGLDRVDTLHYLAHSYYRIHDYKKAREVFEKGAKLSLFYVGDDWAADKYLLFLNWGRCERLIGNFQRAIEIHSRCFELANTRREDSNEWARWATLSHSEIGQAYLKDKSFDKAVHHFALVERKVLSKEDMGDLALFFGHSLVGRGDYESAIDKLEEARQYDLKKEDWDIVTHELAWCNYQLQKYDKARHLFEDLTGVESLRPWIAESVAEHLSMLKRGWLHENVKFELMFVLFALIYITWNDGIVPALKAFLAGGCVVACIYLLYIASDFLICHFKDHSAKSWDNLTRYQRLLLYFSPLVIVLSFVYVFDLYAILTILALSIVLVFVHMSGKRLW